MQKEQIQRLYKKFLDNECSREEFETLLDLVKNMDDKDEMSHLIYQIWKTDRARQGSQKTFSSRQKNKVFKQAIAGVRTEDKAQGSPTLNKHNKGYLWIKVIAVLLLVGAAAFFFYQFQHPGWLSGKEEMSYQEKVTLPGQKSTILLSEGTRVKLNSGSKLIYPERFTAGTRAVTLQGEAFFEVTRDEKKPFIVRSGGLVTTVLGTSFNVRAYPEDDKVEVAVATGQVAVASAGQKTAEPRVLRSNTLATYNAVVDEIKIESVDIQEFIAWKEGVLKFNGIRFEEVAAILQKWYGVPINLENDQIGDCVIFGEFENESLQRVMKVMQLVIDIEYEFTAEGVEISGVGCVN